MEDEWAIKGKFKPEVSGKCSAANEMLDHFMGSGGAV